MRQGDKPLGVIFPVEVSAQPLGTIDSRPTDFPTGVHEGIPVDELGRVKVMS